MASILTVDDSAMMRKFIAAALASDGYDISEAANGQEAIDMVRSNPPDCMVLDLLMPEVDGFDVLEALRNHKITIPVIVMTADVQESTKEKCLALGAFRVLNKPPYGNALTVAVREALALAGVE